MHVILPLALVVALVPWPAAAQSRAEPAATAAREFLAAVRRGDCDRAWTYFSTDSHARIEAESRARIRREPYYAEQFAPRNLYCKPTYAHRFLSYDPNSARLLRCDGRFAAVAVDRHGRTGFLLPGFWSTRTEVRAAELRLVEEAGAWKVVVP
jgi:hypothetical protein